MKIKTYYINEYTTETFDTAEECRASERKYTEYENFPKDIFNSSYHRLCTATREDKIHAITAAEFVAIKNEAQREDFNKLIEEEELNYAPIESIGIWMYDYDNEDIDGWKNFYEEYENIVYSYNKLAEAINAV